MIPQVASNVILLSKEMQQERCDMEVTRPRAKLEMSGLAGFADIAFEPALGDGVSLLNSLAKNPYFLDAYVLPLLEEPGEPEDVAHRYEDGRGSYSLEREAGRRGSGREEMTGLPPVDWTWRSCAEPRTGEGFWPPRRSRPSTRTRRVSDIFRDQERITYGCARRTRQSERSYDHGGRHYRCP